MIMQKILILMNPKCRRNEKKKKIGFTEGKVLRIISMMRSQSTHCSLLCHVFVEPGCPRNQLHDNPQVAVALLL